MVKVLIVVDYQNDFVIGPLGFEKAKELEVPIVKKLEEYWNRGDMIVFTKDMHEAVMGNLDRADVIIKSAAPSDFRVENVSEQKIKRNGNMTVTFTENADIAADVGRNKGDKVLVVFAAESEKLIEHAQKKLKSKNADLIVANDITLPGAGFNSPDNEATIIGHDFMENLPLMSKEKMANKILDAVSNILQSR
jgi:phosphopantothenoylcysteine decarboxylase/phosphopantothenate--cysteine ligase